MKGGSWLVCTPWRKKTSVELLHAAELGLNLAENDAGCSFALLLGCLPSLWENQGVALILNFRHLVAAPGWPSDGIKPNKTGQAGTGTGRLVTVSPLIIK